MTLRKKSPVITQLSVNNVNDNHCIIDLQLDDTANYRVIHYCNRVAFGRTGSYMNPIPTMKKGRFYKYISVRTIYRALRWVIKDYNEQQ